MYVSSGAYSENKNKKGSLILNNKSCSKTSIFKKFIKMSSTNIQIYTNIYNKHTKMGIQTT